MLMGDEPEPSADRPWARPAGPAERARLADLIEQLRRAGWYVMGPMPSAAEAEDDDQDA